MSLSETLGKIWSGFETAGTFLSKDGNMQGLGAIIGAGASIYSTKEQSTFNKEMLSFEKDRISKNREDDEKKQKAYESVWGKLSDEEKDTVELGGSG